MWHGDQISNTKILGEQSTFDESRNGIMNIIIMIILNLQKLWDVEGKVLV